MAAIAAIAVIAVVGVIAMATPYIEVHIDFDEDGVFESTEEVSGDIRQMSIVRGKDVAKHRAPAAQLDMSLNNLTHKYSPSNDESPLYPFQLPGPNVRVRMGYPADSFDGDDNDALDGRTPDLAGSELGTWTATSGMTVQSNVIEINSTGTFIATLDYGEPNVRLAAKVRRPLLSNFPAKMPIFTFRYVDSSNYAYISYEAASGIAIPFLRLHEVVAGVDTQIDSVQAPGTTVWDTDTEADIELKVSGDTVEIYVWESGAYAAQLTGLTKLTGTKHGIGGAGFTTDHEDGGVTWDDFGLLTKFYGRVDTVDPRTSHEDRLAYIRAYDDFERMAAFNLFTGSPTPPADAGDIASRILTRADFDRGSLLDAGTTLTPAAASATQDTRKVISGNALDELYQLQDDEVGFVYLDAAGVCHFEAADHRELNDHDTPISVWGDTHPDEGGDDKHISGPIEWDDGKERVENQIFYQYFRASKTVGATVWFLQVGDDPQFDFDNRTHPNDNTLALIDIVTIGDGDAIADPKIPIPATDYSIDENADGTGQDWLTPLASETGTVSMTVTDGVSATLDDTGQDFTASTTIAGLGITRNAGFIVIQDASGNTAIAKTAGDPDGDGTKVNLLKNPEDPSEPGLLAADPDFDEDDTPLTYDCYVAAAYPLPGFEGNFQFLRFIASNIIESTSAPTAYVTSAQLKADKLSASVPAATRAEDSASQLTYGLRRVQHDTKHIVDWDTAQGRAEKRLELRKDARERVACNMANSTKENLMEMLFREVSDRVRIIYSDMGIDRDHFIENYRMECQQGNWITMRWELTRVVPDPGLNYLYDDSAAKYGTARYAPPDS